MGCIQPSEEREFERPVQTKRNQTALKAGQGFKQQGVNELKKNYYIDKNTKVLGMGAFGKVFMTYNKHDPDMKVAIKVLDKAKLSHNLDNIMDEISILSSLDHPNIVKYYETYNDKKFIYLVMEYVTGMPLFEKICKQ